MQCSTRSLVYVFKALITVTSLPNEVAPCIWCVPVTGERSAQHHRGGIHAVNPDSTEYLIYSGFTLANAASSEEA